MERYASDPHPALAIAIVRASTPSNDDTDVRAVTARRRRTIEITEVRLAIDVVAPRRR